MIERPTLAEIDELVKCWKALVRTQRTHGTIVQVDGNTQTAAEWFGDLLQMDNVRIARINGEIVGFVTYVVELDRFVREKTVGYVQNLYVRENHRGSGIGTALLASAESELAARGADIVTLETMESNTKAAAFYREQGYTLHRQTFAKALDQTDKHNSPD